MAAAKVRYRISIIATWRVYGNIIYSLVKKFYEPVIFGSLIVIDGNAVPVSGPQIRRFWCRYSAWYKLRGISRALYLIDSEFATSIFKALNFAV